jgi:hypothetical protein
MTGGHFKLPVQSNIHNYMLKKIVMYQLCKGSVVHDGQIGTLDQGLIPFFIMVELQGFIE